MKIPILILCLAALVVAGCHEFKPWAPSASTSTAIGKAQVYNQTLRHDLEARTPKDAFIGPLAWLNEQWKELAQAEISNDASAKEFSKVIAEKDKQLHDADVKYATLEAKWYVWLGRAIVRVLIIAAAVWTLAGVAAVVLIAFFPANPLLFGIGRHILSILPLATPFSMIANRVAPVVAPSAASVVRTGKGLTR